MHQIRGSSSAQQRPRPTVASGISAEVWDRDGCEGCASACVTESSDENYWGVAIQACRPA